MDKRDSFVFYDSFMEVVNMLPAESRAQMVMAIVNVGLNDTIPDDLPLEMRTALVQMRASIRGSKARHDRAVENGKKGGAPKGSRNNPNGRKGKGTNQELTKTNLNDNVNVNENVNVNDNNIISSGACLSGSPNEIEEKPAEQIFVRFDDD